MTDQPQTTLVPCRAEVGAYSSVVGHSVHLIAEDGRFMGQIAYMCQDDALRGKEIQTRLSGIIANAINGAAISPAPEVQPVATPSSEVWQPIETAPETDDLAPLILLWEPHDMGGFIFAGTRNNAGEWINNLDMMPQKPTHWMPLPAPPGASAEAPSSESVSRAAQTLLDHIGDGWGPAVNAMTPILRADLDETAWNTVTEIKDAFFAGLRALSGETA